MVSVNGEVVTELGTKIKRSDVVKFHDEPVSIERKVYVLLNKPKDTVTTSADPQERRTVMDLVKGACNERIYPVGPVSYTHLDVYKRQVLSPFGCFSPGNGRLLLFSPKTIF